MGLSLADGGYGAEIRAALCILLWVAVLVGVLSGAFPRQEMPRAALIAGCSLGGLALLSGASIGWATDDGRAFAEAVRVAGYLGAFTLIVCASGREGARPWLAGLAGGILVVGLLAVTSRLIPALPSGDQEIAALLPNAQGRLSFPIGYWNALAALLAVGIVAFTWLGAAAKTVVGRALGVGSIPMLGLGLYLTSSRGGLAATLIGIVVLVALGPGRAQMLGGLALGGAGAGLSILVASRQPALLDGLTDGAASDQGAIVLAVLIATTLAAALLRAGVDDPLSQLAVPRPWGRAAAVAVTVLAVVGIVVANPGKRIDEFKEVPPEEGATESGFVAAHLASGSGSGRYQYWSEAIDAYASEPVHGIGAGGYESYWSEHATLSRSIRDAHSILLELLAELGPLGVLALLAFIGIGPAVALRRRSQPPSAEARAVLALLATGVASAAVEWTWEVPATFMPVVFAVALLTGPALAPATVATAARVERDYSRFGWGVAVIGVAWVCVVMATDVFLAEQSLTRSRSAAADGDLERAADRARDAVALQPWAAEPRLQLALVRERQDDLVHARESAIEATDRAPRDWRVWFARARIHTRAGELEQGRSALREAQRLNPRNPLFAPLEGSSEAG